MLMRNLAHADRFSEDGSLSLTAVVLLGSPGPGIAALISLGRTRGFARSLPFFWGLQVGLYLAAAGCSLGLFSLLRAVPGAMISLSVIGTIYLIWLAYRIGTAPVGRSSTSRPGSSFTAGGGFLLGIANPKAYIAFVSLMSSQVIVRTNMSADEFFKWVSVVVVIFVVEGGGFGSALSSVSRTWAHAASVH
jgi:threonine/homoserine/homoserine lactone efflux protein